DRVDELVHLRLPERADEPRQGVAVAKGDDGGDALHTQRAGHPLVRVDGELREEERAAALPRDLLDGGPERAAGPAPRGPEIDDDGALLRALQNDLLEVRVRRLDDGCGGRAHGSSLRAGTPFDRPTRTPFVP